MVLPNYSKSGQKKANLKVSDKIFNVENVNHNLIKQAYHYYLNKSRVNLAKTKTRSEVRGGGKKPYRQKRTGRARAGTIRSPLWRGGGITFGPTGQENYVQKMNKKAKIVALRHALSLNKDQIIIIASLPEDFKTTKTADLLFKTLKLDKKILLVDSEMNLAILKSVNNLQNVSLIRADYLNVYRILNCNWLVITEPALEVLEKRLGSLAILKDN